MEKEEKVFEQEKQQQFSDEELNEARKTLKELEKEYKYYSRIVCGLGILLALFIVLAVTGILGLVPVLAFVPGIVLTAGWVAIIVPITKMLISKRMKIGSFFYWDASEYVTETTWSDGSKTTTSDGGMASMAFSIMINVFKIMLYVMASMFLSLIYPFITIPRKAKKIGEKFGLEHYDYKSNNRTILKWGAIGYIGVAVFAAITLSTIAIINNVGDKELKAKMINSMETHLLNDSFEINYYTGGYDGKQPLLKAEYDASTKTYTITVGNFDGYWYADGYTKLESNTTYYYNVSTKSATDEDGKALSDGLKKTIEAMLPHTLIDFAGAKANVKKASISKVEKIKYKVGEVTMKAQVYSFTYAKNSTTFYGEPKSGEYYLGGFEAPCFEATFVVEYQAEWFNQMFKQ